RVSLAGLQRLEYWAWPQAIPPLIQIQIL
ncbi:MAG: hypothetical protein RLZZ95_927, partial [Pseudomonadota bacterium]